MKKLVLSRVSDPPTGKSYTELGLADGERYRALLRGSFQTPFLCALGFHHYPKKTTAGRHGPDGSFDIYRCIRRVGGGPNGATCRAVHEVRRV